MTFPSGMGQLLRMAALRNVACLEVSRGLVNEAGEPLDQEEEAQIARFDLELSLVDTEILKANITWFIELTARGFWLLESHETGEGISPNVLTQMASWYPDCIERYSNYKERHNQARAFDFLVDFLFDRLNLEFQQRKKPWLPAARFVSRCDDRYFHLLSYMRDSDRAKIKPHPPFEDWYTWVLELPLPPSYRISYFGRERDQFRIQVEELVRTNLVQIQGIKGLSREFFPLTDDERVLGGTPTTLNQASDETKLLGSATGRLPAPSSDKQKNRQERVAKFLDAVLQNTNERCSKADILRVSGYKDRHALFDWQAGRYVSESVATRFEQVLCMPFRSFADTAKKKRSQRR